MKLCSLQYLRAIASLAVVYSHATIQYPQYQALLPHSGSFGVDIFFVISGFIMVFIMRAEDTPSRFFANRVRRVVPLYWFFTLLMAAILLSAPDLFKRTVYDTGALAMSLLFIPHFSLTDPDMIWPIVAPGWSLNYEMYFYSVFALSLWLVRAYRVWFISAVITLVFMAAGEWQSTSALQGFFSDAIVFEFVFGMLLGWIYVRGWRMPPQLALLSLIGGFGLLLLELSWPRLISFGLPALLVVTGALYLPLPAHRLGLLLGDSSYALYLSHIFTLGICRKLLPPVLGDQLPGAVAFVVLSALLCIVIGVLVHWLIDNWLLREQRWIQLRGTLSGSTN